MVKLLINKISQLSTDEDERFQAAIEESHRYNHFIPSADLLGYEKFKQQQKIEMGADMSVCCSAKSDKDTQFTKDNSRLNDGGSCNGDSYMEVTSEQIAKFESQLHTGINIYLILQDKKKSFCNIRFDTTSESLFLCLDVKYREIPLKNIKTVLHTKEQLKRIEYSAGITDSDTCAALHLVATGNCIPLFFLTPLEKVLFLKVMEKALNKTLT